MSTESAFESEARAFYTCGDPAVEARWDAMPASERAAWTRSHGNLVSVRLERVRTSHPIVTAWVDMTWVYSFYRALFAPFRAAWKAARR